MDPAMGGRMRCCAAAAVTPVLRVPRRCSAAPPIGCHEVGDGREDDHPNDDGHPGRKHVPSALWN